LGFKKLELLYRGTSHGFGEDDFHSRCDDKGATLSIVKSDTGHIFGGYTDIPLSKYGGATVGRGKSFLFKFE